ncbi:hypothetical protein BS47DRAFT_324942 [Hydnum rufescens UP504]|uniref:Protein transport protein sec16 n=1 Tax=Hydnum rufescens UP504 TaxID=1448309 RepID=A0A9P6B626_9AGAM|nr:hypothetical protein BS47DRAFT_324942 [Hydnum rufescens UP504]
MTDSTEEAKQTNKRKSIALAASLFGDTDSNSLDFFSGSPEAPEPESLSNQGLHYTEHPYATQFNYEYTENGTVDQPPASEGYHDNSGEWQPRTQESSYAQYNYEYTEYASENQTYSNDGYYDNYGQRQPYVEAQSTSSYVPPTESSPYVPSPYDPSTCTPSGNVPPSSTSYVSGASNGLQSHPDDFLPHPPSAMSHDDASYSSYDPTSIPLQESSSHAHHYDPHPIPIVPGVAPSPTYNPPSPGTFKASQIRPEPYITRAAPTFRDAAPYSAYDPPAVPSKKLAPSHLDRRIPQTDSFSRHQLPYSAYETPPTLPKPPGIVDRPVPKSTLISRAKSPPTAYDPPLITPRRDSRGHVDGYIPKTAHISTDASPYIPHDPPSLASQTPPGHVESYRLQAVPTSHHASAYSPHESSPYPTKGLQSRTDTYAPQIDAVYDTAPYVPYTSPSQEPQVHLEPALSQAAPIFHNTSSYVPYNPPPAVPRESLDPPDSYLAQVSPILNDAAPYTQFHSPHHPPSVGSQSNLYAPSPSVNAADDLRSSARIPIFCFGFGGKVASCFHSQLDATAGFDVSFTGRRSSPIQIRLLNKLISPSALEPSTSEFPGPLFTGSSGPAMALVRTTASNTSKSKKASVVKYLAERVEEVQRGLGYLSSARDSVIDKRSAEGRAILLKLLSVMVENDGKICGSPTIELQVRSALLHIDRLSFSRPQSVTSLPVPFGFTAPALDPPSSTDQFKSATFDKETPIATYHLRSSALDQLQSLLIAGERRQACHYALEQKMWAHAMLIASSLDKDAWKDATNEFIRSELGVQSTAASLRSDGTNSQSVSNGRESLRVAYSLFSGQVQEFLPPKTFPKGGESLLPTSQTVQPTPLSPSLPKLSAPTNISPDILAKWSETVATIVSNPAAGEYSSSLTALGDCLLSNNWVEAAHVCYLLSPLTSPVNGVGAPSARVMLVGSENPGAGRNALINFEAIRLTEVMEFSLSLSAPSSKEAFSGLPHLQAYKLVRAFQLAELGYVKEAARYCEAISSILKGYPRGSLYFTAPFLVQHKELSDRLAGTIDTNANWISRTINKPSIDSLGTWSLNKLSKFIEGDEPSTVPEDETLAGELTSAAAGPFSHYSEISSVTTSQAPSPTTSSFNGFAVPNATSNGPPPLRRAGSAIPRPATASSVHMDRAASAMDYVRSTRASPVTRTWSADPMTTTFQAGMTRSSNNPDALSGPRPSKVAQNGHAIGSGGWWDGSQVDGEEESIGATPRASTFLPASGSDDTGQFVSLMDTHSFVPSPQPTSSYVSSRPPDPIDDEEEEDLGFGNSKPKKDVPKSSPETEATADNSEAKEKASEPAPAAATKPAAKGWLSGWWGKKDEGTSSGPIRAKLGETKNSFYYDKELKRWVNGKEANPSAPPQPSPPPPSRAQTASPSTMAGGVKESTSRPPPPSGGTPPPRSQSAFGGPPASSPTPPASLRTPSGLSASFIPEVPVGEGGSRPPSTTGRPGQRKNARAKYVDVFNTPPPPT